MLNSEFLLAKPLKGVLQEVPDIMGFGDRLVMLRKTVGFTQQELAKELGVSRRMIAFYEGETQH